MTTGDPIQEQPTPDAGEGQPITLESLARELRDVYARLQYLERHALPRE